MYLKWMWLNCCLKDTCVKKSLSFRKYRNWTS
ncbi:Uncharacterised protein [Mycobacteroides abscessus subsp. abscessus]|nr:Uncharacterised protein [Mycobacteroides abscessus subsp. abscessus]